MITADGLEFCDACDKVTYASAVAYERANCRDWLAGYDCMHLESETLFCRCEVK